MFNSSILGPSFVSFKPGDGSAQRQVEFRCWMNLGGHAVGMVKNPSPEFLEDWQQCHSKKKDFIWRLSHFNAEDIVCGCANAQWCSQTLGTLPSPGYVLVLKI